ncbi:MAG: hypothetical protein FD155_560 [Bacteroidetes bacterium]|nr:MAG: hypothetical protein FD155_560 [Bacteroidota bacterium]
MKKVKISVDQWKLRRETDAMPLALKDCHTLKSYLNDVGLKLTTETLTDAAGTCSLIESQIRESVQSDIANIKNPILIASLTAGTNAAIAELKQKIQRLDAIHAVKEFIELIEVIDEQPRLVLNWRNIIEERASYYITEPKEIAIYEAQLKIIEAVNELAKVKGTKIPLNNLVFQMMKFNDFEAIPEPLNYSLVAVDKES